MQDSQLFLAVARYKDIYEPKYEYLPSHLWQVMKDSQLFLVVAVLLAMDITIMTTWQLADPFKRETKELKAYVSIFFSMLAMRSHDFFFSWLKCLINLYMYICIYIAIWGF